MIHVNRKELCCGCNACGDVCSNKAISFEADEEGFLYPSVDAGKCTGCGLCEKVCPVANVSDYKNNDLEQSVCYAAENKNLEVVFDSTSGGIFSVLADKVYKDGGYVGGAVFDGNYRKVFHFISNDRRDLARLRSSKYLQSDASGFYAEVRRLLRNGEKVLVCGTPCQMVALRAFLGRDYDNLIIVDFICRGINSPKVWEKYMDSFEERYGSRAVWAKSKSKEYGWRNLTQKVILEDGRHIYETKDVNNFLKGYLVTNAYCRPSCYECAFKGYPRMSDITLADFWGIEGVGNFNDKDLGTSLVMLNSKKGVGFFEQIKSRTRNMEVPFEKVERGNPSLVQSLEYPGIDRKRFFEDLDKMSFVKLADAYFNGEKPDTLAHRLKKILRYVWRIICVTRMNPRALVQFFRYNTAVEIFAGNVIVPAPHCVISFDRTSVVHKLGITVLGEKFHFRKSSLETRLYAGRNAEIYFGPDTVIGYGADIEVFDNAVLVFKGNGGCNIGATIICADRIEFGKDVRMGRNVTVRDNNGEHYINRQGYRNSRPVIVGDKVWLCEQSMVLSGVKIGDGAIVGARSLVIGNLPPHSMASGNPAEVIDEDVYWKY